MISHHQRSSLLQGMGTNAKTHSQTTSRTCETREHSPLNEMSPSNPSPPTQRTLQKREEKDCKTRWNGRHRENKAFKTQWNQHTYESTKIGAAWTEPAQVWARWGPRTVRGSGYESSSLDQKLSSIDNCSQRKN